MQVPCEFSEILMGMGFYRPWFQGTSVNLLGIKGRSPVDVRPTHTVYNFEYTCVDATKVGKIL